MVRITADRIRRTIGEPSYSRGQECFERGRVQSVHFETPFHVLGLVSGSRAQVYAVSAKLEPDEDGFLLEGICSCPVRRNCKHMAAVLLAAEDMTAEQVGDPGRAPREAVSDEVRRWLDLWPAKGGATEALRPPGPPSPGRDHMFYVIHRDARRGMCITPYRAYLKKDGTIGSNFRSFDRRSTWTRRNLTLQDAALVGKLDFLSDYKFDPRYEWPEGDVLTGLIREIVETGRARARDIHGIALCWSEPRTVEFVWEVGTSGEQHLVARDGDGAALELLPFPTTPFFIDPETGETGIAETALLPDMVSWLAVAPAVPHDAIDAVEAQLSRIGRQAPVPRMHRVQERANVWPEAVLTLYGCEHKLSRYRHVPYWENRSEARSLVYPCARLEVAYDGVATRLRVGESGDIRVPGEDGMAVIRRDHGIEEAFREALVHAAGRHGGWHPNKVKFDLPPPQSVRDADIVFAPATDADDEAAGDGIAFVSRMVPLFRAEGWRVEIDESWPFRTYDGPVAFSTSLEATESDWFSLRLSMEANGRSFAITPIVLQLVETLPVDDFGQLEDGFDVEEHLAGRMFHARLDDGMYLAIDGARLARFAEAFLEAQGLLGFHRAEAGRLFQLAEALEGCGVLWKGSRELLDLGARLRALAEGLDLPAPAALRGSLRPYQRVGYGWLRSLSDTGFGGVLADDMGLGKTVQTLALLAHRHLEEKTDRPSLLIVPTSLVGNWRREAARFVPGLRLLVLHGPGRLRRFVDIPKHHLVVTTYPLVNRDYDALFRHDYDIAVLDEAQTVKNPAAGVTKRIRGIHARHRLALTGTPVENNLEELWALYDWLIPGLLGNRKAFKSGYRTPIENEGDCAKQRLLSTRIKPFLMRRTKEEVAAELPEKTVIDEIVPLEGGQAALYESIRTAMDARIREAIAARGFNASRIAILDALLKLRQVCCDPQLVKLDAARKVTESAKRARLFALLEELVAEGRKVLIFSQFVEMLRLVEADVVARGWDYAMLHGSTQDRDAQIANFQSGDLPLFLISLKAGGTGLNLTAADTVIVYDPWWNPAVERQAMDRAHRIGQDKPVFVHRLIAEHTVEAAIQKMQRRKQALADALFEGTGQGPLALSDEDIDALFGASPAATSSEH